jgi:hypothetical protein
MRSFLTFNRVQYDRFIPFTVPVPKDQKTILLIFNTIVKKMKNSEKVKKSSQSQSHDLGLS